ncbi:MULTISPECIES: efflux RND transporter periplasmic adaptor subunit [Bradyrhizobium]|uniref:Blr4456 protein n=1 Tax=Bradyrhizobium diazoefficiens (strain JCM 10833 / BCRC 13528 / IAM 13628 / NBRC 14792 / USDA 110) TaxID=224911 RepID=Q89LT7_BRADU|nr:efflux RND transporter periplasmic adaptor subunit [Bradyrhizobium diazoefficiens]MBP1065517.1 multidrug efflux system membrane fusion protein [Bradyrhizobium japonicum]AND89733.1 transporter [Bradyrhizobium diazoefficiens USDA 110]AWO91382.1 efflux RND transporter periplasmic adaptor subunit [Bradyrhizobium diazoefficiens]PDT58800.1 efflux RND transporter periplasmic adaptor subunit [Bradyrhizobium diazoefficiens]QBP23223.1 efflux RND transporter periplasmic adaptor subunit [Bradyrhizobium
MLFKPDKKVDAKAGTVRKSSRGGFILTLVTLAILGGLGYLGWTVWHQQPQQANGRNQRPDLPVPVLAATPRIQDVPVYLDGVGAIRALNTVTVRSQVDGKLIAVNFTEGQDVKKGDVVGEIDPALYQATYDQAVAKKAQDQAQLANQRIDLTRYEQLAASNAGSKQQADTQRALVAQTEALVKADQAAIDNAAATLSYTKIVAPISGRAGLRQVDQGNIIHAADTTGLVVITQLQPIAVWFSLPQQQIMRVNAAAAKGALAVDVFGNDGVTVIDTGKLTGIDNQVDQTTGTLRLKAEFPNANYQLWPGQFVNVRLKVETLMQALVVPTSAVQRGPIGTFSYVIGEDNVVSAKPVTVTQQNEHDAVIASGLSANDRVVTTGFANLSDGSKVVVGRDDQTPSADLAPRKRSRGPDAQKKDGQKDGQGKDGEPRAKRSSSEGDQKGQTGPAPGPGATGSGAKQP